MANIFVQPNIGRHSYFVVCDVNTWTGNVSGLTHWTLDWPGGRAGPGAGGGRDGALDLLQMSGNQKYENKITLLMMIIPEYGLRLAGYLLLWGWGREVGELLALARELVLGLERKGLGLHDLLGDPLDADILVESHLARLGHAGVLRPEARWSLHLKSKKFTIHSLNTAFVTAELNDLLLILEEMTGILFLWGKSDGQIFNMVALVQRFTMWHQLEEE